MIKNEGVIKRILEAYEIYESNRREENKLQRQAGNKRIARNYSPTSHLIMRLGAIEDLGNTPTHDLVFVIRRLAEAENMGNVEYVMSFLQDCVE